MDERTLFEKVYELLIVAASAAREDGRARDANYRSFYVGAAVLARQETEDGFFAVFTGHNYMKRKADPEKRCAEKHAIEQACAAGFTQIIAIVVIGEPQPDDESGFSDGTLHPCGTCRRLFMHHDAISMDTFVLTLSCFDTERLELWTVSQLITTHFLCATREVQN